MTIVRQGLRWLITTLAFFSLQVAASDNSMLKAYPEASSGMQRFVIMLPQKDGRASQAYRVELIVGKKMETDGVNLVHFGGKIEPLVVEGWGYPYYQFKGPEFANTTLMAAPPGSPKVIQFVEASPLLIPYNADLPLVVYVSEGFEVRYRIWTHEGEIISADRG